MRRAAAADNLTLVVHRMSEGSFPKLESPGLDSPEAWSPREPSASDEFDQIAILAARLSAAPISVISFVDDDREWFKARIGLDAVELPRTGSFAEQVMRECKPLIVTDAASDCRFSGSTLVVSAPKVRFYAGVPLVARDGRAFGALAVMDVIPRRIDAEKIDSLRLLANQVTFL